MSGNVGIIETKGPRPSPPRPSPTGVCSLEGNLMLRRRAVRRCLVCQGKMLYKGSVQIADEVPRTGQLTYRWEEWRMFHKLGFEG